MKNIILVLATLLTTTIIQAQTLGDVITDFVNDGGNAYNNAAMKHTRDGSGHFEDIEHLSEEFSYYNNAYAYGMKIMISSDEDWRPIYDKTEKVLNKLPMIKKEKWKIFDEEEGIGKRYYYEKDLGHTKTIELFYGDNHSGEKKIVGIHIQVICRTCQGGEIPDLSNIPKGQGYFTNILPFLQSDEGRKAFEGLLTSADNDFEDIIDFSSKKGNVYRAKESKINPKAETPFIEIYDYPERRELRLTPHRLKGEYGPIDVVILFEDYGYKDLFKEEDWKIEDVDSYVGENTKSHLNVYRLLEEETGFDYNYDFFVIESVKKSSREANDNNTLIPSDVPPKIAAMLGCKSGDCKDGFGELVYINPAYKGEILGYIGHFKNGVFSGSGAYYDLGSVSSIATWLEDIPNISFPDLEDVTPKFIGYFIGGKVVMMHKYMGVSEMDLCKEWNRSDDCEKWRGTLDQYNMKDDRFSVYTYGTRGAGKYKYDYNFIQHQTFENGKTVKINKPFQSDFGICISGKCKDGKGTLKLEGIGALDADFDEEGIASNESILTLLSGEVYEVNSIKGVPTTFRRISVPSGISWKDAARAGAWIMLQENTCLEGDCRNGNGVESFVKNGDGTPKTIPGYFKSEGGKNATYGAFNAYYHTGVEMEKQYRKYRPDSEPEYYYYYVQLDGKYFHRETTYEGKFFGNPILNGKYRVIREDEAEFQFYKDDIRYTEDMSMTYERKLELDKERQEAEYERQRKEYFERQRRELDAYRAKKKAEEDARLLAAQKQQQKTQSSNSSSSSSSSAFSNWLNNSTDVNAMNSIFASPSNETSVAEEYGITNKCSKCWGTGVCYEKKKKWTKVREESMLFYGYTYKDVEYEEAVTCPVCRGSGKK